MNTFAGSVHHKIKNKFKEARTTTDAVVELGDLVLVTLIIKSKNIYQSCLPTWWPHTLL
jgi:hypothetical protein